MVAFILLEKPSSQPFKSHPITTFFCLLPSAKLIKLRTLRSCCFFLLLSHFIWLKLWNNWIHKFIYYFFRLSLFKNRVSYFIVHAISFGFSLVPSIQIVYCILNYWRKFLSEMLSVTFCSKIRGVVLYNAIVWSVPLFYRVALHITVFDFIMAVSTNMQFFHSFAWFAIA